MSVNLDRIFLPIMAVKDEMLSRPYGRILCLSSVAAFRPRQRQIHYASSKGAIGAWCVVAPRPSRHTCASIASRRASSKPKWERCSARKPCSRSSRPRHWAGSASLKKLASVAYFLLVGPVELHDGPDPGRQRRPQHASLGILTPADLILEKNRCCLVNCGRAGLKTLDRTLPRSWYQGSGPMSSASRLLSPRLLDLRVSCRGCWSKVPFPLNSKLTSSSLKFRVAIRCLCLT